jgi:hypothetical protein
MGGYSSIEVMIVKVCRILYHVFFSWITVRQNTVFIHAYFLNIDANCEQLVPNMLQMGASCTESSSFSEI